jgi:hypothetical protein
VSSLVVEVGLLIGASPSKSVDCHPG